MFISDKFFKGLCLDRHYHLSVYAYSGSRIVYTDDIDLLGMNIHSYIACSLPRLLPSDTREVLIYNSDYFHSSLYSLPVAELVYCYHLYNS